MVDVTDTAPDQLKVTSMTAAFALDVILHWPIRHSILLVGDHGIGKDGIFKTAAKMLSIPLVDIRLSQNDVGDIKGMPFRVKGRTLFAPPDWMPFKDDVEMDIDELMGNVATAAAKRASFARGILFFNEINRAERATQQCSFEIVLDRTMNTRELRDGWRVASAVNGDDHYQVNMLDVAFKSRFFVVKFKPSVEEWISWSKNPEVQPQATKPEVLDIISKEITGPLHPAVINFIESRQEMLDPTEAQLTKAETDTSMQVQNRRAWHMFSDCIKVREALAAIGEVPEVLSKDRNAINYLILMGTGYVGSIAAGAFAHYIETNYQTLSGDIILNKWTKDIAAKVADIIKVGNVIEVARYNEMVVTVIADSASKKMTGEQKSNLTAYFGLLPNAQRAHFYKLAIDKARVATNDWYADKKVEKLVLDALMAPVK